MSKFNHILGLPESEHNEDLDIPVFKMYDWIIVLPRDWSPGPGSSSSETEFRLWNPDSPSRDSSHMRLRPRWEVYTLPNHDSRWSFKFRATENFDPSGFKVYIDSLDARMYSSTIHGEISYVRITDHERIAVIRRNASDR